ncbi:hypothetical protein BD414DRAFT_114750 [Trametes punicea]|nr:hypothetical protein BD414DRAFT_114750 [Trametes punicea]
MSAAAVALHATDALQRLDDGCLRIIFELLRPSHGLHSLSLACKWIREACISVLFRVCTVRSSETDRPDRPSFLPRTLWPPRLVGAIFPARFAKALRTIGSVLILSGSFSRSDLPRYTDDDFSPNASWCCYRVSHLQDGSASIFEMLCIPCRPCTRYTLLYPMETSWSIPCSRLVFLGMYLRRFSRHRFFATSRSVGHSATRSVGHSAPR